MVSEEVKMLKDKLNGLESVFSDNSMEVVGVFGSLARGEAGKGSDIDILVRDREEETIGLGDIGFVEDVLEDELGIEVDIVHAPSMEKNASEEEKEKIKSDLIKI